METALLVTNSLLVGITAVYVVLTGRLAREAAKSAEAAAESARAQQAALEAQASRQHPWFKTGGGGNDPERWQFAVRPLLGAYWLREVRLMDLRLASEVEGEDGRRITFDGDVRPRGGALPARVDEVEGVMFEVNLAEAARTAFGHDKWRVEHWRCMVTVSLAEDDRSQRRFIVYSNPAHDPVVRWLRQARELGFED